MILTTANNAVTFTCDYCRATVTVTLTAYEAHSLFSVLDPTTIRHGTFSCPRCLDTPPTPRTQP